MEHPSLAKDMKGWKVVAYRGHVLYVPTQFCLPGEVGQIQEVVHHHLANQIMAGEPIKVVDAEVQLAAGQLGVLDREQEHLVEHWVESLAVHLGLVLSFAVGKQVDLDVRIRGPWEVFCRKVLGLVDLHNQLLEVKVIFQDKVEASAAVSAPGFVSVHRALLVEFRFYSSQTRQGLLTLELSWVEVRIGQVHLTTDGVVPATSHKFSFVIVKILFIFFSSVTFTTLINRDAIVTSLYISWSLVLFEGYVMKETFPIFNKLHKMPITQIISHSHPVGNSPLTVLTTLCCWMCVLTVQMRSAQWSASGPCPWPKCGLDFSPPWSEPPAGCQAMCGLSSGQTLGRSCP